MTDDIRTSCSIQLIRKLDSLLGASNTNADDTLKQVAARLGARKHFKIPDSYSHELPLIDALRVAGIEVEL